MKKEQQPVKPEKKPVDKDPEMDGPFSEKDEVKKAEEKMRKSADKAKGK